jgi:very-short-patch-repair endonuclease
MGEEDFIDLYLKQKLTHSEFQERGILPKILNNTVLFYREKYAVELKERRHYHYSKSSKGNTRKRKDSPGVLIPIEQLQPFVDQGYSWQMIAKELGINAWFVRQNLKHYGLGKTGKLPYRLMNEDFETLKTLEQYSPGLVDAAIHFYDSPHTYYSKLHLALSKIIELTWFIKDQASGHHQYRSRNALAQDHICWSLNRHEILVSMALLNANIPHLRQVVLIKNYMADFGFPRKKLLVEIDGNFHKQRDTKTRDRLKAQIALQEGYQTLRYTTKDVDQKLPRIIDEIRSALDALPLLPLSE